MTATLPGPAATATGGGRARPRLLISTLALTQTVGYGVLFYSFPVLLTPIAQDLRTSAAAVTGALTASIVVAAAAAIPIGRWLDRHGGRTLMTGGSVLGVTAVLAWSQVQQVWQLYAVFALIGLASAASLYEAAFAVIIAAVRQRRRDTALLAVTIVAGFASSIFIPVTGLLLDRYGWRVTLLVLAGVLAATAIPAHAVVVPRGGHRSRRRDPGGADVGHALRDRGFWLLGAGFVAQAAAVSAVGVLLVTYLRHAGHTATAAATLSGLLGVMSVAGRVLTTGAARRFGMTSITAGVFTLQAVGLLALPHLGGVTAGAAGCVIAFGLGFGVATIAKPAILANRYGTSRFATIAATMALPITLARAFAPLAAAALALDILPVAAGIACLAGAVLLWCARDISQPAAAGPYAARAALPVPGPASR